MHDPGLRPAASDVGHGKVVLGKNELCKRQRGRLLMLRCSTRGGQRQEFPDTVQYGLVDDCLLRLCGLCDGRTSRRDRGRRLELQCSNARCDREQ